MRIFPKKSLGQNFLTDKNIIGKILKALELKPSDSVLEIGSGKGDITSLIAPCVGKLYAVEIDKRLLPELSDKVCGFSNVTIINNDILKVDIESLLSNKDCKLKVFGNIPYYISSPIIEHLLNFRLAISEIFIMLQKELAERIAASPGSKEYSSFSCFVQYYALPEVLFHVKKGSFRPAPKVDSSLLYLKIRNTPLVYVKDEVEFFNFMRKAFSQRRKTLRNSLGDKFGKVEVAAILERKGLNINVRPEELSLQDFADLFSRLS